MPDHFFIIVLHFTVLGHSGRALPPDAEHRKAFAELSVCTKTIPRVRRSLSGLPVTPDKIVCERMEVVK